MVEAETKDGTCSKKAVVLYSGGMDSFTLIHDLWTQRYELKALSFNYGQRHKKELELAAATTNALNVPHSVVDLSSVGALLSGSSLTSKDVEVPEGNYADENMKRTVVPNRNCIMLAVAIGHAVSLGYPMVYCAVHAGDHAVYPDCRPVFIDTMRKVAEIANYSAVKIEAPYLYFTKKDILRRGAEHCGLKSHDYDQSWTCYKGGDKACGRCGSCVERLEAFEKMYWVDPLPYEDKKFWKEALKSQKR